MEKTFQIKVFFLGVEAHGPPLLWEPGVSVVCWPPFPVQNQRIEYSK